MPTVLRLSDEAETALGLARPGELGAGEPAPAAWRSSATREPRRRSSSGARPARGSCEAPGATPVPGAGEGWARDRYRGPYLRDALLDAGLLVETLETVTFWSSVRELYAAVASALRESLTDAGHAAGDPLPRVARIPERCVAVLHGRVRSIAGPDRAVARGEGGCQ